MKKIDQKIVNQHNGDCTRACLVSILELDIDSTPNFIEKGDNWFGLFWTFLRDNNCEYHGTGWIKSEYRTHGQILSESPNVDGFVIASVASSLYEGTGHSVVMDLNGVVVHDPNPNKAWQDVELVESKKLQHWMMIGRKSCS
jgi:hypothetical protein